METAEAGKPVDENTLLLIAKALDVQMASLLKRESSVPPPPVSDEPQPNSRAVLTATPSLLRADVDPTHEKSKRSWSISFTVAGELDDDRGLATIAQLPSKFDAVAAELGIPVSERHVSLTVGEHARKELGRTLALVYGIMVSGEPYWAFVAIRTTRYREFLEQNKKGAINIQDFDYYGEVIVFNATFGPTDDVIAKVAEMYKTDPVVLLEKVHADNELKRPLLEAELSKSTKPKGLLYACKQLERRFLGQIFPQGVTIYD